MSVKRGVKVAGNEVRIIIRKKTKKKGGLRITCQGGRVATSTEHTLPPLDMVFLTPLFFFSFFS